MVIARGELWWAELDTPSRSEPGYRRPVLILQADFLNRSKLQTVMIAPITSNLVMRGIPGSVAITRRGSRLPKQSVVNLTQVMTIDRSQLVERIHRLSPQLMREVASALALALDIDPHR